MVCERARFGFTVRSRSEVCGLGFGGGLFIVSVAGLAGEGDDGGVDPAFHLSPGDFGLVGSFDVGA